MRLGLFVGSFDPFHIGHFEIVDICLKNNYVDKVAILANNPNKSKPDRLDVLHRINMIKLYIGSSGNDNNDNNNNIMIIDEDCNTYVNNLDKGIIKIGIIGSDQCFKKPKLNANRWIIIPRNNNILKDLNWNEEIVYLPAKLFKNQQGSSTMIRKDTLINHKLINNNVLEYIQKHNLYNFNQQLINNIGLNDVSIQIIIFIKLNVFLMDDGKKNKKYIIKIFLNKQIYDNEVAGYDMLKKYHCHIPSFNKFEMEDYCMLLMEYIGVTVYEYVKLDNNNTNNNTNNNYNICNLIGKELRRLHKSSKLDHDPGIMNFLNNRKIKNLLTCEKLDPQNVANLIKNPGHRCCTHGDMSVDNVLIDKEGCNLMIGFIDPEKYSLDGIPAYEYYQFISSIKCKILDENIKREMINGFVDGYGEYDFTQEMIHACKLYWNI